MTVASVPATEPLDGGEAREVLGVIAEAVVAGNPERLTRPDHDRDVP